MPPWGGLEPGQASGRHSHNYESILYIPVWSWHRHVNSDQSRCLYLACENAHLLQNLGNIALREEPET